ncbi:hypothetical protein D3C76_583550 [compost metagenome]|jgi:CRISPR/Cas system CMR-associated protein Cmr5 small subunit|uniref:DUF2508 family protein n=1 Tax=Clostridium intestinale TaxID=36845 RepID=A0A7D6VPY1_9CLOT|nr:DUF2508 family protein [Clostridium intestinale]QLY80136.1 DUF2508 family protein [Clostridium intestinale]
MNKNSILKILFSKEENLGYDNITEDIYKAIKDIESAQMMFETVNNPTLIEVAIYTEQAAKRRLDFLIKEAKERGVRVDNQYILDKYTKLA